MSSRQERKENVIKVLNEARSMELQAIHQYMNQHYNLDDRDLGELAANVKLIAIDEMRHAEAFAERVLELGGEPTSELHGSIKKGQETVEMFLHDAEAEGNAMEAYNQFARVASENGDSITKKLFEQIIEEEQEHLNYFEDVAGHIETLGNVYLARVAGTSSDTGGASKSFVNQA